MKRRSVGLIVDWRLNGQNKIEGRNMSDWVSFEEQMPPEDSAHDDESIKATRMVLVTNNLTARNRMGCMSHVWLAMPIKTVSGEIVAFDEADRKLRFLTHWKDAGIGPCTKN